MRYLLSFLLYYTALQVAAQSPAGKHYALFIVITDYDHWTSLPGTDAVPRQIAYELENNYNFEKVDFRLNLTKTALVNTLLEYRQRKFEPNDQLLVYFSMHGYFDQALGAIIPRDGRLNDLSYESWIPHSLLESYLTQIPCEHLLFSLDACYSGTFGPKYQGIPGGTPFRPGEDCASKIEHALKYKSRLFVASGTHERIPHDSNFGIKWMQALRTRNEDEIIDFYELSSLLLEAYPKPYVGGFRNHVGGGDFVLIRKDACPKEPSPMLTPVRTGTDYALFIVVSDYDHWPDLIGIDQEINEIAEELEGPYGFFKPHILLNPTRSQILAAITDYQNLTFGTDDQLLIFFSMHGQYDGAMGAIIPKDGKLEDPTYDSWITHPTLEALLTKIKCQHILLALDACYSGTFSTKFRNRPDAPDWEGSEDCASKCKKALQHKSRLYLTSGNKERTPAQSQFIRKWLEALRSRNSDGILGYYELYNILAEATPTPMFGEFRENVVGGDFVFVSKNNCSKALSGKKNKSQAKALDIFKNDMVFVKGGKFKMGCTEEQKRCDLDQTPPHPIVLDDFFIGKYEVTQKQWELIMGDNPSDFRSCPECPVENVSWNDIQEFIQKIYNSTGILYRLPTEAEWEYAARGGQLTQHYQYAGSNHIDSVAWYRYDKNNKKLNPVGRKKPNELGLFDMNGNVDEWCADWYNADYYKSSITKNPLGPSAGNLKVVRGGSIYSDLPQWCNISYRMSQLPTEASTVRGFRLARTP